MSYETKLEQEIRNYRDDANVHELPPIYHYWSNKHLRPKLESLGFSNPDDFYVRYIAQLARSTTPSTCNILSLGAGNCDTEVRLSELLATSRAHNFAFHCLDINPQMLALGVEPHAQNDATSRRS